MAHQVKDTYDQLYDIYSDGWSKMTATIWKRQDYDCSESIVPSIVEKKYSDHHEWTHDNSQVLLDLDITLCDIIEKIHDCPEACLYGAWDNQQKNILVFILHGKDDTVTYFDVTCLNHGLEYTKYAKTCK